MPQEPIFFKDKAEWRRWLQRNHDKSSEIWIITYKRHVDKQSLSYEDALEEALCYGWIDSRMRRIDDEKHTWRFTSRKPNSIWSLSNRRRAEKLIMQGRMSEPGVAKIDAAKKSGKWDEAYRPSKPPKMPDYLKEALMKDDRAWRNFQAFAGSYRHTYIHWVTSAKREETRERRIEEVVRRARQNIKNIIA
jgi:uncharacterized protein YdeI (YjbR/CyaY-like superfamily)